MSQFDEALNPKNIDPTVLWEERLQRHENRARLTNEIVSMLLLYMTQIQAHDFIFWHTTIAFANDPDPAEKKANQVCRDCPSEDKCPWKLLAYHVDCILDEGFGLPPAALNKRGKRFATILLATASHQQVKP